MSKRVCPQPGCPTLTDGGRCAQHRREADAARGRRQARGYDRRHELLRARWQRRIDRGEPVHCWRCGERIWPGMTWHLGHDDHDRSVHRGPECVGCNTATAARR